MNCKIAIFLLFFGIFPLVNASDVSLGDLNTINNIVTNMLENEQGRKESLAVLMHYAQSTDTLIRVGAVAALGTVAKVLDDADREKVIRLLTVELIRGSHPIRREAALALGSFVNIPRDGVNSLVVAAKTRNQPDVSLFSIQALGRCEKYGEIVVPALIEIIIDNHIVRSDLEWKGIPAVAALASYKSHSSEIKSTLGQLIDTNDPEFLAELLLTIASLDPSDRDLIDGVNRLLLEPNAQWRLAALRVAQISTNFSIEFLAHISREDPNEAVRFLAQKIANEKSEPQKPTNAR